MIYSRTNEPVTTQTDPKCENIENKKGFNIKDIETVNKKLLEIVALSCARACYHCLKNGKAKKELANSQHNKLKEKYKINKSS